MTTTITPWIPCPDGCGDHFCNIHNMHAHECQCPPIDEWTTDPYSPQPKENLSKHLSKFTGKFTMEPDHYAPKPPSMTSIGLEIARHLNEKQDAAIRQAINNHIGREDWTINEVISRLAINTCPETEMQTILMDGTTIMSIGPVEMHHDEIGRSTFLRATQKFKILNEAPTLKPRSPGASTMAHTAIIKARQIGNTATKNLMNTEQPDDEDLDNSFDSASTNHPQSCRCDICCHKGDIEHDRRRDNQDIP